MNIANVLYSEYSKYNSYKHTTSKQHTLMPYTAAAVAHISKHIFVRCDIKKHETVQIG